MCSNSSTTVRNRARWLIEREIVACLRSEARDAVSRGLFTYGDGGCNVYFGSPTYSVPDVSPANGWRWSSDLGGKVKGGLDSAWYWDLEDGSAALIGNSVIYAIWVRTASPAELGL